MFHLKSDLLLIFIKDIEFNVTAKKNPNPSITVSGSIFPD